MLMRSPSDSMFCRSACLIYWTPEQLKCRSVTGVLSNKYRSLGQTQAKPAMTPEKLNALKGMTVLCLRLDQLMGILCHC